MCLVLFAVDPHPDVPLVLLANRDEVYARPTARAGRWADAPRVLAGRDLDKGGTWVGVAPNGRFAAVTNVRHPSARRDGASRGALVADYLRGSSTPERFARELDRDRYPAFNLLLRDESGVYYATEAGRFERVGPGVHGLSNARLDDPWPKVTRGTARLSALTARLPDALDEEAAFGLLGDRRGAPD
ncbi:MAG: NRDE family protein, partial [Myxococcales bacterium]|nr:NRDE family protein [Myxococcales bacterium]